MKKEFAGVGAAGGLQKFWTLGCSEKYLSFVHIHLLSLDIQTLQDVIL